MCTENHDDSDEEEEEMSQWRSIPSRVTPEEIEEATKHEDELLAAKNIPIRKRIREEEDSRALVEEEEDSKRQRRRSRHSTQMFRDDTRAEGSGKHHGDVSTQKRSKLQPVGRDRKGLDTEAPLTMCDDDIEDDKSSFFDSHVATMPPPAFDLMTFRERNPTFVLNEGSGENSSQRLRVISVAEPLARVLKQHQKEGIQFMFQNTFSDLAFLDEKEAVNAKSEIGGCILAHHMGLGKDTMCRLGLETVSVVIKISTNILYFLSFDTKIVKKGKSLSCITLL